MNRFANTSWLSSRQISQHVVAQRLPIVAPRQVAQPIAGAVQRATAFVPSWIFLAMILLAAVGVCSTVNLRARTQLQSAATQFSRTFSEVEFMRKSNLELQVEIRRMTTEPAMIESAARSRLGMVRPTDIVVPIESQSNTNLATLSFVR